MAESTIQGLLSGMDPAVAAQITALMGAGGLTDEEKRQQKQQAAFAAAAGFLSNMYKPTGIGIGAGIGAGLLGYNEAGQSLRRDRLAGAENMHKAIQSYGALQGLQQGSQIAQLGRSSMIPGQEGVGPPSPDGSMPAGIPAQFDKRKYQQGLWAIDPNKALAFEQAQAKESPFAKLNPSDYTPESMRAYMVSGNPADLQKAVGDINPLGKINPSDFTPSSIAEFAAGGGKNYSVLVPVDKRPLTNVNVKNVTETEYDKQMGKATAEAYIAYQDTGRKADARITRLNTMDALLKGVDTNSLTPVGMKVAGTAKALGLDLDPNLPAKQAAEAIANQMALESRQGGQMPGAMSDKDREFLQAMNPNLGQTPQGRALLIDTQKKVAQREKEVAKAARDYAAKNKGRLDANFDAALAAWADANPLFPEAAQPAQSLTNRSNSVIRYDKNGRRIP